jgi:hypothetical protein
VSAHAAPAAKSHAIHWPDIEGVASLFTCTGVTAVIRYALPTRRRDA